MKKLSFSLVAVLSLLIINTSYAAQPKAVFGPAVYERRTGGPEEWSASFDACDPAGSFTVIVENGGTDGRDRVSSGTVLINGVPAVTQSDFNRKTGRIERPVYGIKKTGNTLDVRLQSAPGSKVTVSVEGIMRCLEVHITSPANGDTISDYGAIVQGTIEAQDGSEVGVTVNSVAAEVSGKAFAAAGVPLAEGENTLSVKATDEDGNTAEDSVKVWLINPAVSPVYFSAYPASGQAPLDVKFTVDDTIPQAKTLYEFDWEGDGVADEQVSDTANITSGIAQYISEGLYFPTVTIKNADGEIFSKKILVNVFRMPDLGKKWDNMRAALMAGKIDEAVKSISNASRESFRKNFSTLAEKAPLGLQELVTAMASMTIYKFGDNYALGHFKMTMDGHIISCPVQFIKDADGIWRIDAF